MAAVPPTREFYSSADSLLEELSVDVLTKILEFSVIPERLNIAMCNKSLLAVVTEECSSLWVHIDFNPLGEYHDGLKKTNKELMDDMLAALLTRVNAKRITKSLRLLHCTQIVGQGLEPLRGSRILERIDLRHGWDERGGSMNESLVMDILRTMFRYKLFHVRFQGWFFLEQDWFCYYYNTNGGMLTESRARFNRDLQAAKRQQALEQGKICSSCPRPVSDASRQIVASKAGLPPPYCSQCDEQYCRTATCPVGMKDCGWCGTASCELCNYVRRCTKCCNAYCSGCKYVSKHPCLVCSGIYCGNCCESVVRECSTPGCGKSICSTCVGQEEDTAPVKTCPRCDKTLCIECGQYEVCPECNVGYICHSCAETGTCDLCNEAMLIDCGSCFQTVIKICSICEKSACTSCSRREGDLIGACDACYVYFCKECRPVGPCSCGTDCCYRFCSDCDADYCNYLCSPRASKRLKRSDSDSEDSV